MWTTLLLGLAVVSISAAASARLLFGKRPAVTVTTVRAATVGQGTSPATATRYRPPVRRRRADQRVRITPWERARAAMGLTLLTAAIAAGISVLLGSAVFAAGLLLQRAL